jgi:hypothetical protein
MIEQALRSFCEARHRTLIVIAGTFVVGLVLVLPLVDVIRAGHDEKEALLTELDSAKTVAGGLKSFETQVKNKLAELDVEEARTVNDETMPALREKLVDLAKETACSVRRITVGAVSSRGWKPGENPIGPADPKHPEPNSQFVLEWRPVSVSLSGTSQSLRSMLERVSASGMLVHAKSFEMYPSSPTRQTLTLDLELWYYTLAKRVPSAQVR